MIRSLLETRRGRTRGTVLIVAMWIVLVLVGLVLVFARSVRVEMSASANHVAGIQAEAAARGALQFVIAQLDGSNGMWTPDETTSFEAVPVGDGFFWVLQPNLEDDTTWHFSIRDEAARINLNSATNDMLLRLPGMTAELAASIIDWRDGDSEVSPGGSESEYYLLLEDPYYCKNGPFETIEEVLLVRDADLAFLFGEDANANGVLDANENDADASDPPDNRDGRLDRGIFDYVTVYSKEPDQSSGGEERVNMNQAGSRDLSQLLRGIIQDDRYYQVMDRVRAGRPFANVLDFYFAVELTPEEFSQIADRLTTGSDRERVGLVNINAAPREVLLCLPGLEESDADALIARRQSANTDLTSIAWVAEVLPREKAVAVGDVITTRSYQFSADIVAVSGDARAFRRYRAMVDAASSPPRVLYWKDMTHFGWPLDPEILIALRSGEAPEVSLTFSSTGAR